MKLDPAKTEAVVDQHFSFPLTLQRLSLADIGVSLTRIGSNQEVPFTLSEEIDSEGEKKVKVNLVPNSGEDLAFKFTFKDENENLVVSPPIIVKVASPAEPEVIEEKVEVSQPSAPKHYVPPISQLMTAVNPGRLVPLQMYLTSLEKIRNIPSWSTTSEMRN